MFFLMVRLKRSALAYLVGQSGMSPPMGDAAFFQSVPDVAHERVTVVRECRVRVRSWAGIVSRHFPKNVSGSDSIELPDSGGMRQRAALRGTLSDLACQWFVSLCRKRLNR